MPDLSKKVSHIETCFFQPHFAGLGTLGPSVLLAPKYVLPDRQHLESVAQGLTVMGECSLNNKISKRKGAVLQN